MTVQSLGWTPFFDSHFDTYRSRGCEPARVAVEHKTQYRVLTADGETGAVLSGSFQHRAVTPGALPTVGDWVAISRTPDGTLAVIHGVLPRKSSFSRLAAGGVDGEQLVAANIDTVFLAMSLNSDYNLRRVERYLAMAWDGGTAPVIVLTKADLYDGDPQSVLDAVSAVAPGVPVHAVSAETGWGMEHLAAYLGPGQSVGVLGSSGVGKSTLINTLTGSALLYTGDLADYKDRGRHTTTHRQLVVLKSGGIIIDTPGMRELRLWEGDSGLAKTFADIEELAGSCRFGNCSHTSEPGCAVLAAFDSGTLDPARYAAYDKLRREANYFRHRQEQAERRAQAKTAGRKHRRNRRIDIDDDL